jgi:predicted DNA-binding protein with PD1-like motif
MNVSITAGRQIMGRLPKGSDLLLELEKRCAAAGISLGEVRALGAVSVARFSFYHQVAQQYRFIELEKPLEIISLLGNISLKDAKPFVHAHIILADEHGQAFGGHLAEGTRVFVCEFVIQEYQSSEPLVRHFDEETGLFLWPKDRPPS